MYLVLITSNKQLKTPPPHPWRACWSGSGAFLSARCQQMCERSSDGSKALINAHSSSWSCNYRLQAVWTQNWANPAQTWWILQDPRLTCGWRSLTWQHLLTPSCLSKWMCVPPPILRGSGHLNEHDEHVINVNARPVSENGGEGVCGGRSGINAASVLQNNGACLWCSFSGWMFSTRETGANMRSYFPLL